MGPSKPSDDWRACGPQPASDGRVKACGWPYALLTGTYVSCSLTLMASLWQACLSRWSRASLKIWVSSLFAFWIQGAMWIARLMHCCQWEDCRHGQRDPVLVVWSSVHLSHWKQDWQQAVFSLMPSLPPNLSRSLPLLRALLSRYSDMVATVAVIQCCYRMKA